MFILFYTNNTLLIIKNSKIFIMDKIRNYFELNKESAGYSKLYLEGSIRNIKLENRIKYYNLS